MSGAEIFGFGVGAIVVFYMVFTGYMVLNESRIIFNPQREITATPAQHGLEFSEHYFNTQDGVRLHGWFVPAVAPKGVVLFFHGNTGNLSNRIETLEILHGLHYSVFIFDYRGYGRSEGKPSEDGTYQDARAAWEHVTGALNADPGGIVIFGRSLGGAIATHLATEVTPRALIVESSFTSMPALGQQLYPLLPVKYVSRIRYDSLGRIKAIKCPLLIVHSRDDELIPFAHGQALHDAYSGEKTLLAIRGRHNDGFVFSGAMYSRGVAEFLARYE